MKRPILRMVLSSLLLKWLVKAIVVVGGVLWR